MQSLNPSAPESSQIDEILTQQLTQKLSALPFHLLGASNGIVLDYLQTGKRVMIFIQVVVSSNNLNFDLCFADLGNPKVVLRRIPLVYSGILHKAEEVAGIQRVEIQIKQSPKERLIFGVKIRVTRKNQNQSNDTMSLLVLDPEKLENQKLQCLTLLKIKCADTSVLDFSWLPTASLTLLILLQSNRLQIWNLSEEDFISPTYSLNLKNFIKSKTICKYKNFTSFCVPSYELQQKATQKININKYCIFLSTNLGEIYSLFPFIPIGAIISRQQYDWIYDQEQNNSQQKAKLVEYFNSCELEQIQNEDSYFVISMPILQNTLLAQSWLFPGAPQITQTKKMATEINYYGFLMVPLNFDALLVLQVVHRKHSSSTGLKVSIITKKVQIQNNLEVDNVVYPIFQVRNAVKNNLEDLRILSIHLEDFQRNFKKSKGFYYVERNGMYHLDLTNLFKFLQGNSLSFLQGQNKFPVTLLFQLPQNQNIAAMVLQYDQNSLTFVRRSQNKIKLQMQPLKYLNSFSEIQDITRMSSALLKKLNNLRVEQNKGKPAEGGQPEMNLNAEKIKEFQEKGLGELKKQYDKYCDLLRNSIDGGMSKLKTNYEIMNKRLKQFNTFKDKRTTLNSLLQKVKINNSEINQMLFNQNDRNKSQNAEMAKMESDIINLHGLLNAGRKKELSLNPESEKQLIQQIDLLFQKLKNIRVTLQEAKRMKKSVQEQRA